VGILDFVQPLKKAKTNTGVLRCAQNDGCLNLSAVDECNDVRLHVELEEENISVFDDVLFAFGAKQAGLFNGLLVAIFEEVG
jgi:hypothetical protein